MFKKLLKSKLAQTTAEYALLIALVVAAVIAMQTYAQRAIQSRIRGAAQYMVNQTNIFGNVSQYEAYYQESGYDVDRATSDTEVHNNTTIAYGTNEARTRRLGGTTNVTKEGMAENGI